MYIVGNERVPKYSSMSHCEYQMVKCESGQEAKKCEYIELNINILNFEYKDWNSQVWVRSSSSKMVKWESNMRILKYHNEVLLAHSLEFSSRQVPEDDVIHVFFCICMRCLQMRPKKIVRHCMSDQKIIITPRQGFQKKIWLNFHKK